jgi:hypothetical protein
MTFADLTAFEIADAYRAWWSRSYPNNPATPQTIANVVAFVQHLQRQENKESTDDLHR